MVEYFLYCFAFSKVLKVFDIIGKQVQILYGLAAVNEEFSLVRLALANNHWTSFVWEDFKGSDDS